jgi:hypothetical protein
MVIILIVSINCCVSSNEQKKNFLGHQWVFWDSGHGSAITSLIMQVPTRPQPFHKLPWLLPRH